MSQDRNRFSELITPSFGVSVALIALDLAIVFAIWAALGEVIALSVGIVLLLLSALWWRSAIHRTHIDKDFLHVNQAKIELSYIGELKVLDEKDWANEQRVNYNPSLFHAHRFWIKRGIYFEVKDSRDPHPGWLIGSKKNVELSKALSTAKQAG